jgi:hypothetical protein
VYIKVLTNRQAELRKPKENKEFTSPQGEAPTLAARTF